MNPIPPVSRPPSMNQPPYLPMMFPGRSSAVIPVPPTKRAFCKTPNNTIYVSNLNEKIKLPRLKKSLFETFEKYGKIIQIVLQGSLKMHGQAFVVFEDLDSAIKAVKELNNQPLFNRAMAVQFSENKSDVIASKEGESIEERKKKRLADRELQKTQKQVKPTKPSNRPSAPKLADQLLMNKTLFIQNIPKEFSQQDLESIFMRYHGFREVRLVPGKQDLAFVEYETEIQAALAKDALFNYRVADDRVLVISFAKR